MKNILFLLILLTGFFASSAVQTQLADKVIIGRASSADKTIGFNHDLLVHSPSDPLSMLNPSIKLNRLTGTLQTSNNGANYRNLNVYSGVGETNLLENNGFEMYREFSTSGTPSGFYGWSTGSGVWPITSGSNVLTDSKSLRFNGTFAGDYLYSNQYAIPKRLYGRECLAKINYTTGAAGAAAKVYLEVYDGSGLFVAGPSPLSEVTSIPKELKLNFTCPSSGTIGLRVTSAGNSLYHYLDDAFLGEAATAKVIPLPTVQRFTSGSGTYTTPINVKYIKVRGVGGGGGGGGGGTGSSGGTGGAGGNTTFGSSLLTAPGGSGGAGQAGAPGTGGIAATINSPAITILNVLGGEGGGGGNNNLGTIAASIGTASGVGGHSHYGGAGKAVGGSGSAGAGGDGKSNTGGGGGGGTCTSTNSTLNSSGSGGGGGAFFEAMILSPSATYSYSVGAAGTAGSAGINGAAGGAGGSGIIIVEEYY